MAPSLAKERKFRGSEFADNGGNIPPFACRRSHRMHRCHCIVFQFRQELGCAVGFDPGLRKLFPPRQRAWRPLRALVLLPSDTLRLSADQAVLLERRVHRAVSDRWRRYSLRGTGKPQRSPRRLCTFLMFYTLVSVMLYSAISYKTPCVRIQHSHGHDPSGRHRRTGGSSRDAGSGGKRWQWRLFCRLGPRIWPGRRTG